MRKENFLNSKLMIFLSVILFVLICISVFLVSSNVLAANSSIDSNIKTIESTEYYTKITLNNDTWKKGSTILDFDNAPDSCLKVNGQEFDSVKKGKSTIIVDDDGDSIGFKVTAWFSGDEANTKEEMVVADPRWKSTHSFTYNHDKLDTIVFSQNIESIDKNIYKTTINLEDSIYKNGDYLAFDFKDNDKLALYGIPEHGDGTLNLDPDYENIYTYNNVDSIRYSEGKIIIDDEGNGIKNKFGMQYGDSFKVAAWYSEDKEGSYTEHFFTDPDAPTHSFKYEYYGPEGKKGSNIKVDTIEISQNIKYAEKNEYNTKFELDNHKYKNNSYLLADFGCHDMVKIPGQKIDCVKIADNKIIIDDEGLNFGGGKSYKVAAWYSGNYKDSYSESFIIDPKASTHSFAYTCTDNNGNYLIDTIVFSQNIKSVAVSSDGTNSKTIKFETSSYNNGDYIFADYFDDDCYDYNQNIDYIQAEDSKLKIDNEYVSCRTRSESYFCVAAWYSWDKENSYSSMVVTDTTSASHYLDYNYKDENGKLVVDTIEFSQNIKEEDKSNYSTTFKLDTNTYKNNDYLLWRFDKDDCTTIGRDSIDSVQLVDNQLIIDDECEVPLRVTAGYSKDPSSFKTAIFSDVKSTTHALDYNFGKIDTIEFSQNIKEYKNDGKIAEIIPQTTSYENDGYVIWDVANNDCVEVGKVKIDSIMKSNNKLVFDDETNIPYKIVAYYGEDESSYVEEYIGNTSGATQSIEYKYDCIYKIEVIASNIESLEKNDSGTKATFHLNVDSYKVGDCILEDFETYDGDYFHFGTNEIDSIKKGEDELIFDDECNVPVKVAVWYSKEKDKTYTSHTFNNIYSSTHSLKYEHDKIDTIEFSCNIESFSLYNSVAEFTLENDSYAEGDYLLWDFGDKKDCLEFDKLEIDSVLAGNDEIIFDEETDVSYKVEAWYSGNIRDSYSVDLIDSPKLPTHSLKYTYKDNNKLLVDNIVITKITTTGPHLSGKIVQDENDFKSYLKNSCKWNSVGNFVSQKVQGSDSAKVNLTNINLDLESQTYESDDVYEYKNITINPTVSLNGDFSKFSKNITVVVCYEVKVVLNDENSNDGQTFIIFVNDTYDIPNNNASSGVSDYKRHTTINGHDGLLKNKNILFPGNYEEEDKDRANKIFTKLFDTWVNSENDYYFSIDITDAQILNIQ